MTKRASQKNTQGFTIVELLIVVVVIAILAAITIAAYNGIQNRAKDSSLKSTFSQTAKALEAYKVASSTEQYPTSLSSGSITQSSEYTYNYQAHAATAGSTAGYCLTLSKGGESKFITSAIQEPTTGSCDGLVGWWSLNEQQHARDTSGYGRNGQGVDTTTVDGYGGKQHGAYRFSGEGHINVVSDELRLVHNNGEASYSMWVNFNGTSVPILLSRGTPSGGNGWGSCQYEPAIYAVRTDLSGCAGSGTIASYTLSTGWSHLVLTISKSQDSVNFYRNGENIGSKTLTAIRAASSQSGYILNAQSLADFLVIGGVYNANTDKYAGSEQILDDVRVYNRALSASEASALYRAGAY